MRFETGRPEMGVRRITVDRAGCCDREALQSKETHRGVAEDMRSTLRKDLIELFSQAGNEFISGQKSVMLSAVQELLCGSILKSFGKRVMK